MAKKRGYDVVCVGSATIDAFVRLPVDLASIKHGSKVLIDEIDILTGGGGTNVAVGLARLGLKAGFIGEVGNDLSAGIISRELDREGVDFLVKEHSRHKTAFSVILEAKGKDRSILVHKGASSFLHANEIPRNLRTDWYYFGSMMGASFETMLRIARIAKRTSTNVFFNPSSYMVEQGVDFLRDAIEASKIILMNKEEAQVLLKDRSSDVRKLLKGLKELGPEICIITDGSKGVHVFDGRQFYSGTPNKLKPVDTTGAGDAFGTGFLAGWIMKSSSPVPERIRAAIKLGMCESESVIMYTGAKTGLLTRKKALSAMKGR
ncbi:carbohydrate kinase family protein [Candidatus Woesearchaeota archaeon]|nr:carbohydrate kinase family protein [Candidatus Woesearchaeota archaeon]